MARFCYCFVTVGQKLFMLKEMGFQKSWSQQMNDQHNERMKTAKSPEMDKDNHLSYWWII
jgi:hypothetical protein